MRVHTPTHTCVHTHRHSQQHGLPPLGRDPPEGVETCSVSMAQKDYSPSDGGEKKTKHRPRSRPRTQSEQSGARPESLKAWLDHGPDPVRKQPRFLDIRSVAPPPRPVAGASLVSG